MKKNAQGLAYAPLAELFEESLKLNDSLRSVLLYRSKIRPSPFTLKELCDTADFLFVSSFKPFLIYLLLFNFFVFFVYLDSVFY